MLCQKTRASVFADDIVLQFGPKKAHDLEDVKRFFTELDEPFVTQHFVDVVFQYGNAHFVQAGTSLRKKGDPPEKSFQAAPLFNLLWFNDDGKVTRHVVDLPPEAAKSAISGEKISGDKAIDAAPCGVSTWR